MQRILRINLQTRNQALKSARKDTYDKYRDDWKDYATRHNLTQKRKNEFIRTEKKSRREDWLLGPLAPKRDVGANQNFYGTVTNLLYQGPVFPPKVRKGPKGDGWSSVGMEGREEEQNEWEGVGNEGNIVEGDRVVVVSGKAELIGQIGKVKEVATDSKEVRIEGLNMADVEVPENFPEQRESLRFTSLELPVPIDSVRLIHRLTDRTTGKDRDVLVKLIRGGAPFIQREMNSPLPRHSRYIAGENIEIPWPSDLDVPMYDAYEGDTTRYDVESQSWTPSVYEVPVPEAAFKDLLGGEKYSRGRRWHEEEYVRMKVLEDARAGWYMGRKIQGPLARLAEEKRLAAEQKTQAIVASGMSKETETLVAQQMTQAVAGRALVSHAKVEAAVRKMKFKARKTSAKARMVTAIERKTSVARKRIALVRKFKKLEISRS